MFSGLEMFSTKFWAGLGILNILAWVIAFQTSSEKLINFPGFNKPSSDLSQFTGQALRSSFAALSPGHIAQIKYETYENKMFWFGDGDTRKGQVVAAVTFEGFELPVLVLGPQTIEKPELEQLKRFSLEETPPFLELVYKHASGLASTLEPSATIKQDPLLNGIVARALARFKFDLDLSLIFRMTTFEPTLKENGGTVTVYSEKYDTYIYAMTISAACALLFLFVNLKDYLGFGGRPKFKLKHYK